MSDSGHPLGDDSATGVDSAQPTAVRIRSSAWVLVTQVGKTALSIPLGILLARTLGPAGKGAVSVVQTVTGIICLLFGLGMPSAVMWLAAKGKATSRGSLVLGGVFAGTAVVTVGALTVLIGPQAVAVRLGLDSGQLFVLAIVAILPSMLGLFNGYYMLGRGEIRITSIIDLAVPGIQLSAMAVLALTDQLTVFSALVVWLVAITGTMLLRCYFTLKIGTRAGLGARGIWLAGRAFALKSWAGEAVTLLSLRQDLLLLAAIQGGTREVGIYTIAVTAAELVWYVPNALQSVSTVKFAAEGDSTELAERLNRSTWPFTLAFAVIIFLIAAPLIPLVYGGQFRASVLPLLLLLPGVVIMSMSTSLSAWFTGRGRPQEWAMANVANVVVNLVANLMFIPRFGAAGAALASTVSYSVAASIIVWRFHARTGARFVDVLVPRGEDLKAMFDIGMSAIRDRLNSRGSDAST